MAGDVVHISKDHPHLRGENGTEDKKISQGLGSPPLTWGKPAANNTTLCTAWITPTYVGKTSNRAIHCFFNKDHPHLRGENNEEVALFARRLGSPPLTWGKHRIGQLLITPIGITPTYVGKT